MSEIPNRLLSPQELAQFQKEKELEKILSDIEAGFMKRAEQPSKWFGRILILFLIAIFLDLTGWVSAFISGRFYAMFATVLQTIEALSVFSLAGLAIYGMIEAYRQQQALQVAKIEFLGPSARVEQP